MAKYMFFVTLLVPYVTASRTRMHKHRVDLSSPSEKLSAIVHQKSQAEKEDLLLDKTEFDEGPFFEQCGMVDEALNELSQRQIHLNDLGMLAKSGQFFRSDDRRWLVKAIKDSEESVLRSLNTQKPDSYLQWYTNCDNFRNTVLAPIVLSLYTKESFDNRPYIIMANETARFERLVAPSWDIEAVYDMKPLPNLAEDLGDLVESMESGFLSRGVRRLKDWHGWDIVQELLKRDVSFLAENSLVDFSLFIHVFKPREGESGAFKLGPEHGCIVEPSSHAAMCFLLIDFLTKYTFKRQIESMYKHEKFHEYSSKMATAFECLGDLSSSGCASYVDYKRIIEATESETENEVVTLLSSSTFKEQYACTAYDTRMVYDAFKDIEGTYTVIEYGEAQPYNAGRKVQWHERGVLSEEVVPIMLRNFSTDDTFEVADALSAAASITAGVQVIAADYKKYMSDQAAYIGLNEYQLNKCMEGIEEFATHTRGFHKDNTDLRNVLLSPKAGRGSIIVARRKKSWGSHSSAATKMRGNECFLRTNYFLCHPKIGNTVVFDYKHTYGGIEVLVVDPAEDSGEDYKIWKEADKSGLLGK